MPALLVVPTDVPCDGSVLRTLLTTRDGYDVALNLEWAEFPSHSHPVEPLDDKAVDLLFGGHRHWPHSHVKGELLLLHTHPLERLTAGVEHGG